MSDLLLKDIGAFGMKAVFGGGTGFMLSFATLKGADQSYLKQVSNIFKLGDVDIKLIADSPQFKYTHATVNKVKTHIIDKIDIHALNKLALRLDPSALQRQDTRMTVDYVYHNFYRTMQLSNQKNTIYYIGRDVASPWQIDIIDINTVNKDKGETQFKLISIVIRFFLLVRIASREDPSLSRKLPIEVLDVSIPFLPNHLVDE